MRNRQQWHRRPIPFDRQRWPGSFAPDQREDALTVTRATGGTIAFPGQQSPVQAATALQHGWCRGCVYVLIDIFRDGSIVLPDSVKRKVAAGICRVEKRSEFFACRLAASGEELIQDWLVNCSHFFPVVSTHESSTIGWNCMDMVFRIVYSS